VDSTLDVQIMRAVRTYHDIQKLRVSVNNRVAVSKYTVCPERHMIPLREGSRDKCPLCGGEVSVVEVRPPSILVDVLGVLEEAERRLYRETLSLVRNHPLWSEYLGRIRGVGAVTAAYLVTVLNPARFETPSKMWKYCGLHVVDGKAPRRVAGRRVDWNPEARTVMWKLGESFRMAGGFYKYMYRVFYEESTRKHPDWTKATT
jgi:Transposase IS116/IS110/IS902 family.